MKRKARIRSKHKASPFMLQVTVTDRGVFFDRTFPDAPEHHMQLMHHSTHQSARSLATWILENVPE